MDNQSLWQDVSAEIAKSTGSAFKFKSIMPVHGGDINTAYRLQGTDTCYFVKLNRADRLFMFAAEVQGLKEIADSQTLRVPDVIACAASGHQAFLVLEYIDFGRFNPSSWRLLGRQLAKLHRVRQPFFGWHRDNTIGSTLQVNEQSNDWPQFWQRQRLGFQLQWAAERGYGGKLQRRGEQLSDSLAGLFSDYRPYPSLLHGDLWAGNVAVDGNSQPLVYDPACYYGDREADVAMTELFGGFGADFYAAYRETWPLEPGYAVRKLLYNLYHVVNHLNLFGPGYLGQAEALIERLLSELN
ncbi:MAG: hypothetical protein CVV13_08480 [Gammaproteobacteria bacterium HGW-Gammaproteobacteria-3]|nr:MAG: hypothetical protein CVV13_08480 [Gammaproteobacteria bacterium HGW-Gammaproteobacteria-3]